MRFLDKVLSWFKSVKKKNGTVRKMLEAPKKYKKALAESKKAKKKLTKGPKRRTWNDMLFFQPKDFDSPDSPGSGEAMDFNLVLFLEDSRTEWGKPIYVNSGVRTVKRNKAKGGKKKSEHLDGQGADIKCKTSKFRYFILDRAIKAGIQRIGIGKTFIHIGLSKKLPQKVTWLY